MSDDKFKRCIPYLLNPLTDASPPKKGRGKGRVGILIVPSPPFSGERVRVRGACTIELGANRERSQFIIPCKILFIIISIILLLPPFLLMPGTAAGEITGKVVDSVTKKPIKDAIVTSNHDEATTDGNGIFVLPASEEKVAVRAMGFLRVEQSTTKPLTASTSDDSQLLVQLTPFTPKALYLSPYGIGTRILREPALKLLEDTELNALVIDVKGDRSFITYRSSIALAAEIGAQRLILVKDMKSLMKSLKEKGIYTIARIVVFKDDSLAKARPDLAIKTKKGTIWYDRENLAWVDPSRKDVWDYNIDIAIEAAQHGFDEIQFDYVRFPDASGQKFANSTTEAGRIKAITEFLKEAKRRLAKYNVFLAADIFGYVCWNLNDTFIGQRLEELAQELEVISPMLYPSGFQYGIPGYRNPVANSYEIVYRSLKRAQERTQLSSRRFRPWIQAFKDYSFDRRHFTGKEIREQIDAAEKFGSHGWMIWNPRNAYVPDGLKKKDSLILSTSANTVSEDK